ncbi:MAG: nucleotidyltransferase [Desulfobacterium sp.]|nr:nucleotidyltransferase [Desulfobacterium sp.]MBU3946718.1 nucleotidyltransferase domain-containing protein [Pseudomonadota bacterium]MBU4011255.1 nucleotidyltransferase domain-containing protein [Pseudomonadota bacterium]MBU4037616.1 nucleotidyltransferase domain-containing protein [Pseudomonadota bacterium]
MQKIDILDILRDYKKHFAEKYGILSIGIFGSVARDEIIESSDVDICIKTTTPNPFILVHIKDDIEKRVHKKVDIVRVWEKMNPYLKDRIEKEGIYV